MLVDYDLVVMRDVNTTRERLRAMRSLAMVRDREALVHQVQRLREASTLSVGDIDALADAVHHEAYGTVAALAAAMQGGPSHELAHTEAEAAADDGASRPDEVSALEEKLAQREEEEAELQRAIHAFSTRYREELGPLVTKLLRLRKEQAEQSLYARRGDAQRRATRNKAEAQFERFQSILDDDAAESPPDDLSDEQQAQLKATFRKASKQCHPDMVDPAMEDEARTYFNALREAYQQNDVERVNKIAQTLDESGFAQRAPDETPGRSQLDAKAERLRRRIASVEASIRELRATEAYEVVTRTDDADAYFDALKQRLRREIRRLHRGGHVS